MFIKKIPYTIMYFVKRKYKKMFRKLPHLKTMVNKFVK